MPIIALLVGLVFPRLIIFFLWLLTNWFDLVDWVIALLGFLFMPYTLLWYSVVMHWYSGVWDFWQILILVIAILSDLGSSFASKRKFL